MGSNTYATNFSFDASSCGAAALPQPRFSYGFLASGLHVANTCGVRVFYNLTGGAATTAMGYLSSGASQAFENFESTGLGLTTTSTSTGAGAQPLDGITSWGP